MYGIFTYIWLICMVDAGKYTIHGCYGNNKNMQQSPTHFGALGSREVAAQIPFHLFPPVSVLLILEPRPGTFFRK